MTLRRILSEVSIIWEPPAVSEFTTRFRSDQRPFFYLNSVVSLGRIRSGKVFLQDNLALKLGGDRKFFSGRIPPDGQHIRLAAHLAVLYILLFRPCRLIHRGLDPLSTPCAPEPHCMHLFSFHCRVRGSADLNQRRIKRRTTPDIGQGLGRQGIYVARIG